MNIKLITLSILSALAITACSSGGGSGDSANASNSYYAIGDVRKSADGEGQFDDARHKIVQATDDSQKTYKKVYDILMKDNNSEKQNYTVYGYHNMGSDSEKDMRVVFSAREMPETLPDTLHASYTGKATIEDPTQQNQFLPGTLSLDIENEAVTGSIRLDDNNGALSLAGIYGYMNGRLNPEDSRNFSLVGGVTGSVKGNDVQDGRFYGFVAGPHQEEVVGAVTGELSNGQELQGAFVGKKQ
ncbi:hypothetical protein L4F92_03695 [Avibacterium sp. 21-595]|uniref:hypothetical protein n=1 Tax=Avibacterium sp. 21-595 TaxID=2911527 RepID=UPI002027093E|nr:hypothetical protein [Avibacterium sp. 21-595]URL07221.1 hypothetical protein L4F92_03695 [Avibacterium sp. 21-595]